MTPDSTPGPCIVLVDGEHYPPVVARAVAEMRARGEEPVLALLVGGREKLGQAPLEIGVPVETPADPEAALAGAIARVGARRVVDLSDEPVLGYVRRCRLASVALHAGAEYLGPDFRFTPPPREVRPGFPSVAILGTGKRTGKTAVGGAAARAFRDAGLDPVVVAMGRGGPPEPEVIRAGDDLDPATLLGWVEQGRHAASDYIEDALTARVPTVGAWRAGGGLAGAVASGNYARALERARELAPGMLVLEGSGSAIPPCHFDAGVLIVNAGIDPGFLCGYFGLYRLLLADLVVLTMCEESISREQLQALESCIRRRPHSQPRTVRTVFRPHPLADVRGKRVWFGTTAPHEAGDLLRMHLERVCEAKVVGMSHALADREALRRDLDDAAGADVLLVELKAAAVDVVTRAAVERGLEVVFVDNRPLAAGGEGSLDGPLLEVAGLARERFARG